MSWRISLVCGLVAAALVYAPNQVAAGPDRVAAAQRIAEQKWGPACGGNVTIERGDLPAGQVAYASYRHPPGGADNAAAYFGCTITFRRGHIPWRTFCAAYVHEHLHLRAWRPPPGQEFVRRDGTRDPLHSRNPRSILHPVYAGQPYPPCGRQPPPPVVATRPVAGPTVLVLPGGGWQNADPATMDPWVRDFRAHGIRARAVTYPLRDVPAAIEHVRQIADGEPGPVILYGISAGGTIAAALAATGDVAGAVNIVGPTDFARWITPGGIVVMRQIGMTTTAQKRAASPYWRLNGRQAPQLVQCGIADPIVTCDQGLAYVRAARRQQPDTRLQVMANAHGQLPGDRRIAREWIAARWPTRP